MCSVSNKFAEALTGIFWDLDACPIPVNLTPASIYDNLKISRGDMGYTGEMLIFAYSSKSLTNAQDFESANIKLMPNENKHRKHDTMRIDISMWGLKHRFCRTNIMVISKVILDDNNLVAALLLLKEHENNVLLALPSKPSNLLCRVSTLVWLWSSLSKGGAPNYINQLAIQQSEVSLCRACETPLVLCSACKKPMQEEAEGSRSSQKACRKRKRSEEKAEGRSSKKKRAEKGKALKKKKRATAQSDETSSPNLGKTKWKATTNSQDHQTSC